MSFKILGMRQQSLRDGKNPGEPYNCSLFTALREFSKDDVGEGNAGRAHPNTKVEKTELKCEETKVVRVCRTGYEKGENSTERKLWGSAMHVRKLLEARERSTPQNEKSQCSKLTRLEILPVTTSQAGKT